MDTEKLLQELDSLKDRALERERVAGRDANLLQELDSLKASNEHLKQKLLHAENDLVYAVTKATTRAREAESARDKASQQLRSARKQVLKEVVKTIEGLKENDFLGGEKTAMITLDIVNNVLKESFHELQQ